MKLNLPFFVLGMSILMFCACNKDEGDGPKPISTSINKILPLGASRVEGARPNYESYRYELWKDLKENHWTFDFIGTQSDNAGYPSFNDDEFDVDHEGRGGWTSGEILEGLDDWLSQTGPPDIVLLSSPGANDALQGLSYSQAVSNINAIIDLLQVDNPNVTIIIEQMAPGRSDIMTTELTGFFEQIQQEVLNMTTGQTTSTSQVLSVDLFTGFNNDLLADDVHYNESGADFIANRYYNVLVNILE